MTTRHDDVRRNGWRRYRRTADDDRGWLDRARDTAWRWWHWWRGGDDRHRHHWPEDDDLRYTHPWENRRVRHRYLHEEHEYPRRWRDDADPPYRDDDRDWRYWDDDRDRRYADDDHPPEGYFDRPYDRDRPFDRTRDRPFDRGRDYADRSRAFEREARERDRARTERHLREDELPHRRRRRR